jgi:hypothetical protein
LESIAKWVRFPKWFFIGVTLRADPMMPVEKRVRVWRSALIEQKEV